MKSRAILIWLSGVPEAFFVGAPCGHFIRSCRQPSHPDWQYYFPVRWLLIPHGVGGLTALLIGPF